MATITKRKGRHQVQIRRVGQPFTTKSFSYLADAKHWALQIESSLEQGEALAKLSPSTNFSSLANRYAETIHKANLNLMF